MCRFLAYAGAPVFLEDFIASPCHSLIHQSLHAEEAKTGTNGDGFGVGWYGERAEPGQYREIRPAWSDENLLSIARLVRSHLFFAHVRAATGTASTRANCHPFVHGRHLFMHNGQIGEYSKVRRVLEALIPDEIYDSRRGNGDSEAIFLIAMGLEIEPVKSVARALNLCREAMRAMNIEQPLGFSAVLADGETMHAFRWVSDSRPPSLYWRALATGTAIASEPFGDARDQWTAIPPATVMTVTRHEARIDPFEPE